MCESNVVEKCTRCPNPSEGFHLVFGYICNDCFQRLEHGVEPSDEPYECHDCETLISSGQRCIPCAEKWYDRD